MSAFPPRLRPLLDAASPVQQLARRLVDAGHECYLVGGSVRDAFLDRTCATTRRSTSTSRPTPGPTSSSALVRPWADAVWLQGQRFGTVGCRKDGVRDRDHDVPRRGVPAREPQARGRVLRRHRDRPLAARLHRQRDGAAAARPGARRPVRRRGRPRGPPAAHAARARGLVRRRPAAHAARGALHRASSGSSPTPELVAAVVELRHRLEIVSAERIRDELSKLLLVDDPQRGPVVPRRDRPRRRVPARAQPRCGSSRTRSTRTRTCSRTRSRSCATRGPSWSCASPRCSTTSASRRPGRSPTAA